MLVDYSQIMISHNLKVINQMSFLLIYILTTKILMMIVSHLNWFQVYDLTILGISFNFKLTEVVNLIVADLNQVFSGATRLNWIAVIVITLIFASLNNSFA